MAKKNTPKRIFAGAMALLSVAAYVPMDGISSLVNNYSIVASAEAAALETWLADKEAITARDAFKTLGSNELNAGEETENVVSKATESLNRSNANAVFKGGDVAVEINDTSGNDTIGAATKTTVLNNVTINASKDITIAGNVIMNDCKITMKGNTQIKVTGTTKLWLNGTTVERAASTKAEEYAANPLIEVDGTTSEALTNKKDNVGTALYLNAATVNDKATYSSANANVCAIRNHKGVVIIGDGESTKTINAVKVEGSSDKTYSWNGSAISGGATKITSTGAAIQSGAGSYLCILDGEISGYSNETATGSSGIVSGVVEIAGNADLVGGSVKDSEGKHAVTVIRKNGSSWYKNEQTDGSKAQKVNIGGYTDKSFTINGGLDVAQQPVGANDKVDDTQVSIADGATVDNVTMGLPGYHTPTSGDGVTSGVEHYNGGVLNVTGGNVGSIKKDNRFSTHGTAYDYSTDDKSEVGGVNITGGTVGSVDIPVTEDARTNVTISGGTVEEASPEFYQHIYNVVSKAEGENTVVTISCTDTALHCGLEPITITFKTEQEFAIDKDAEKEKYAEPAITVSGGTETEDTVLKYSDVASYKMKFDSVRDVLITAIKAHGIDDVGVGGTYETNGGRHGINVEVTGDGTNVTNESGLQIEGSGVEPSEGSYTFAFTYINDLAQNTSSATLKVKSVAAELKSFTVTDPTKFFTELTNLKATKDETAGADAKVTDYNVEYDATGISKSITAQGGSLSSGSAPGGVVFYKVAEPTPNIDSNKFVTDEGKWAESVPNKSVKSITAEFSKDGSTWTTTIKDAGTYKVRYILVFNDPEVGQAKKPNLTYNADYTITITPTTYLAGPYVREDNTLFNDGSTSVNNKHKVTDWQMEGSLGKKLVDAGVFKATETEGVTAYAVGGKVGDKLDDIFSDAYAYSKGGVKSANFQAGVGVNLYARKFGSTARIESNTPLTAGVFEIYGEAEDANATNYKIDDRIIGYVVISGLSLADTAVKVPQYTFMYDGKTKQVDIDGMTVTDNARKKVLKEGIDFKVTGTTRGVVEGDYTFNIEGMGDYDGSNKQVAWHIVDLAGLAKSKGAKVTLDFENHESDSTKISAVAVRNVPTGYTLSEFGIIMANKSGLEQKDLNLEKATAESGTLTGSVKYNRKTADTLKGAMSVYALSAKTSSLKTNGASAVGYMILKDADNNEIVIYSNDGKPTQLEASQVANVAASTDNFAPKLQYETVDGNVNKMKFTVVRNLPKNSGYTVKEMGFIYDTSSSDDTSSGKTLKSTDILIHDDDTTTKAPTDSDSKNVKIVPTKKGTNLTSASAAYSFSGTFNNPDVQVNVRPYMILTKGDKDYYIYGEQIFIGKYGYTYSDKYLAEGSESGQPAKADNGSVAAAKRQISVTKAEDLTQLPKK